VFHRIIRTCIVAAHLWIWRRGRVYLSQELRQSLATAMAGAMVMGDGGGDGGGDGDSDSDSEGLSGERHAMPCDAMPEAGAVR